MKNKINEASVNLDLTGLISSDLQALSQILALAGLTDSTNVAMAPEPTPVVPEMGAMDDMSGMGDAGVMDVMGKVEPEILDEPPVVPDTVPDMGAMDAPVAEPSVLDNIGELTAMDAEDSLTTDMPDMGMEPEMAPEMDDMGDMEIVVEPEMEPEMGDDDVIALDDDTPEGGDEFGEMDDDDGFADDLNRITNLSGIAEDAQELPAEDSIEDEIQSLIGIEDQTEEAPLEEAEDDVGEMGEVEEEKDYMPDFDDMSFMESVLRLAGLIQEVQLPVMQVQTGVVAPEPVISPFADSEYGPYNSATEAHAEAHNKCGKDYKLINKPDGVYWIKTGINEDVSIMDAILKNAGIVQETRLLPNLDLDEDAVGEMTSMGLGNNTMYGPYNSALEAQAQAQAQLGGGTVGINFKTVNKPDGVYWTESVNEMEARPEFTDICTAAIRNNKHVCKDTKEGDVPMKLPVTESVEDLHAALNEAFKNFKG